MNNRIRLPFQLTAARDLVMAATGALSQETEQAAEETAP